MAKKISVAIELLPKSNEELVRRRSEASLERLKTKEVRSLSAAAVAARFGCFSSIVFLFAKKRIQENQNKTVSKKELNESRL